ncbi:MAG: hypothetical protein E7286_08675 [Lachnospiraceae bacterium]|nr:hypothetical protein [Lachnospiraceae bacterium]
MSKKEAEDIIGSSLLEDSRRTPAPDGIEFYISDVEYLLNGMSTNASFEFHNDKLWIVQFYYNIDENPQEWFKSVIEELTALYGMETDKFTNTNGGTTNVGYKWDSNNTSFQIVSMMNQAAHMQVIISIGLCEV